MDSRTDLALTVVTDQCATVREGFKGAAYALATVLITAFLIQIYLA